MSEIDQTKSDLAIISHVLAGQSNCFQTLVSQLDSASDHVYLNVYEFTHPILASKLKELLKDLVASPPINKEIID